MPPGALCARESAALVSESPSSFRVQIVLCARSNRHPEDGFKPKGSSSPIESQHASLTVRCANNDRRIAARMPLPQSIDSTLCVSALRMLDY